MDMTKLEATLRQDEGDREFTVTPNGVKKFYMYPDSEGVPTIGIGHNMRSKMTPLAYTELYKALTGEDPPRIPTEAEELPDDLLPKSNSEVVYEPKIEISEKAANELFKYDLKVAIGDAQDFILPSMWEKLGCVRQEVLVNMAFNLGGTRLREFDQFQEAIHDALTALYNADLETADEEFKRAGDEMFKSIWWGQVGWRSKRLQKAWLTNDRKWFQEGSVRTHGFN